MRYKEFFELYLGHSLEDNEVEKQGIIHRSLSKAVNDCCPGMTLNFTRLENTSIEHIVQEEILHHHLEAIPASHLVFYFPEFTTQGNLHVYSHEIPFLNLRKSPGLALVMLESESHLDLSISDIIVPSWPIFVLVLSLSWAIGILGWSLESFTNAEEFPRPFIRGMFEGFWWAIITMTTVGYGDKSPKSILARILCVLWILAGAVLLSLFTANMTSIITANRINENGDTMGKKIGVVNMEDFVETELNLGAQLVKFDKVQLALEALKEKTIERLLFPHYLDLLFLMEDKHFASLLSGLHIAKVFDNPFQIGMVLSHRNKSFIRENIFYTCLEIRTWQFSKEFQYDYSVIADNFGENKAFNTESTLKVLYVILGIIGFMIIVGVVFDLVNYCHAKKNKDLKSDNSGVSSQDSHGNSTFALRKV